MPNLTTHFVLRRSFVVTFGTKMADNLGPIVGARETGVVEWKPKMELMTPLLEMGLSENSAKRVNLRIL